jgi:hypothetical protein
MGFPAVTFLVITGPKTKRRAEKTEALKADASDLYNTGFTVRILMKY